MCACLCVCEYPFVRVILLSSMKKSEGRDYVCVCISVCSQLFIYMYFQLEPITCHYGNLSQS